MNKKIKKYKQIQIKEEEEEEEQIDLEVENIFVLKLFKCIYTFTSNKNSSYLYTALENHTYT